MPANPEDYERLRDPRLTMPVCGHLVDQKTQRIVRYDPDAIAPQLQRTILSYVGDPPRTADGQRKWLVAVASRQVGKSITTALALLTNAMYSPNTFSALITDKKDRADDLFRGITNAYHYWPEEVRVKQVNRGETRQMTFEHRSKIVTLSAQGGNPGIGRAFDYLHCSELPYWPDAGGVWNGMLPAIVNRDNASVILESTPAPIDYPSAEWFSEIADTARRGKGRFIFAFAPFFESTLNERRWDPTWTLSTDEQKLLEHFGARNYDTDDYTSELTLRNLAFRREIMASDSKIRRHPELFKVFYPTDPYTCWVQPKGAAIPATHLDRHWARPMIPWGAEDTYKEYANPRAAARYVIGVDPAGWMGGDQAAFHVLEVWGDRWEQVACFSSNAIDPPAFAEKIIEVARRFNDATVIVESNGVGLGTLTPLVIAQRQGDLKNLYHHAYYKPGIPASAKSVNQGLGYLIDALAHDGNLVIRDQDTLKQLSTYRHDKRTERSETSALLRPEQVGAGRRAKHHWDKVSALIWTVYAARLEPLRTRPESLQEDRLKVKELQTFENISLADMGYNDYKAYQDKVLADAAKRARRKQ